MKKRACFSVLLMLLLGQSSSLYSETITGPMPPPSNAAVRLNSFGPAAALPALAKPQVTVNEMQTSPRQKTISTTSTTRTSYLITADYFFLNAGQWVKERREEKGESWQHTPAGRFVTSEISLTTYFDRAGNVLSKKGMESKNGITTFYPASGKK